MVTSRTTKIRIAGILKEEKMIRAVFLEDKPFLLVRSIRTELKMSSGSEDKQILWQECQEATQEIIQQIRQPKLFRKIQERVSKRVSELTQDRVSQILTKALNDADEIAREERSRVNEELRDKKHQISDLKVKENRILQDAKSEAKKIIDVAEADKKNTLNDMRIKIANMKNAINQLKEKRDTVDAERLSLREEIDKRRKENDELRGKENKLEATVKRLTKKKKSLVYSLRRGTQILQVKPGEIIKLNVSGDRIQVSTDTLKQSPVLAVMISRRFKSKKEYFIDRDPFTFKQFLHILRDGSISITKMNHNLRYAIEKELDYFGISYVETMGTNRQKTLVRSDLAKSEDSSSSGEETISEEELESISSSLSKSEVNSFQGTRWI